MIRCNDAVSNTLHPVLLAIADILWHRECHSVRQKELKTVCVC